LTAGIGSVMGHVGSAVQGAMGHAGSAAAWGQVARSAAAHALGGAAANTLTGGSFSWRQVAASAVGSVASAAATNALFGTVQLPGGTGTILSDTATGLVGGLVSAHTRRAFGVGSVNEGRIALDAFGNALGNALNRRLETAEYRRRFFGSASEGERSWYASTVAAGAKPRDLLAALANPEYRQTIARMAAFGHRGAGVLATDTNPFDWLAAADRAYPEGRVSVGRPNFVERRFGGAAAVPDPMRLGTFDFPALTAEPVQTRIGRKLSIMIDDGARSLDRVIGFIGEGAAASAAVGLQIALGGPLRAGFGFAFDRLAGHPGSTLRSRFSQFSTGARLADQSLVSRKPKSRVVSRHGANGLVGKTLRLLQ
jgi:hypothetical protein